MSTIESDDATIHYELLGDPNKPLVMLLAGLGGAGPTNGEQIERFASRYRVVLPDQRGTGRSTRTKSGHTIEQNARDMAAILRHLELGPAHIVGSSTGGAIAQLMALDHADVVRSLTLASSWARRDAYLERELQLRIELVAKMDPKVVYSLYALLLFSPRFVREHADFVTSWVARATSGPADRETSIARLEMILAHDSLARLGALRVPTLVVCGELDVCTPPHLSDELASAIAGAERAAMHGGHMIHAEDPDRYFEIVSTFLDARA